MHQPGLPRELRKVLCLRLTPIQIDHVYSFLLSSIRNPASYKILADSFSSLKHKCNKGISFVLIIFFLFLACLDYFNNHRAMLCSWWIACLDLQIAISGSVSNLECTRTWMQTSTWLCARAHFSIKNMQLETVTTPELKTYFSLSVRVPLTEKAVCLSLIAVNCNTWMSPWKKCINVYLCVLDIEHDKIF